MFRLASVIGKATFGLPFKYHPAAVATSPCLKLNCYYSKQKIIRTHDLERCPDKPPSFKHKKDGVFFYGVVSVVAAVLMAGGFVAYAKTDKEFRDWLSVFVPWADDFVAIALEENMSYAHFVNYCFRNLKKQIIEEPQKVRPCSMGGDGKLPESPADDDIECEGTRDITDEDVCEMEACVRKHGNEMMQQYKIIIDATGDFAKKVDDAMGSFNFIKIKALEQDREVRNEKVRAALASIDEDVKKLDELTAFLSKLDQNLPSLDKLKLYLQQFLRNIDASRGEMIAHRHEVEAYDAYYDEVMKVVNRFIAENKDLFAIDYLAEKPHIKDDPDLFFILTDRLLKTLEADLNSMLTKTSGMASRGVESLPEGKRADAEAKIKSSFASEKGKMTKEIDDKVKRLQKELDDKIKDTLADDAARFQEHLKKLVSELQASIGQNTESAIAELVAQGKNKLDAELAEIEGLADAAERKLEEVLLADRERTRARELWNAGAAILAAMKDGTPIVKLNDQIKTLEKAGKNDKLVIALLKSIPDNIRKDGIVPETVLRGRYHRMEDVALKVALVEQEGGPLPVYAMSLLQSLLLFIKFQIIPRNEIENPPDKPPDYMDTFDLLQRARYWVDRGHLTMSLRYVTALEGASRSVAETWLKAAKDNLQMKQVAEAIMSHATAISLNYI